MIVFCVTGRWIARRQQQQQQQHYDHGDKFTFVVAKTEWGFTYIHPLEGVVVEPPKAWNVVMVLPGAFF